MNYDTSTVPSSWGECKQLNLLNLIPTLSKSSTTIGPKSPPPHSLLNPLHTELSRSQRQKRCKGEGSGYIQLHYCEKQTRAGVKSYQQYYYHYELTVGGERVKRSAYIPKDKLDVVLEWERKKVAIAAILSYLGKPCTMSDSSPSPRR